MLILDFKNRMGTADEPSGELDGLVAQAQRLAGKSAKVDNITAHHYYGTIVQFRQGKDEKSWQKVSRK